MATSDASRVLQLVLTALVLLSGAWAAPSDDPTFPLYHVRPPTGHNNDPNAPFWDPLHEMYHLFMQYCPNGAGGQHGCGFNHQAYAHFTSPDLVMWRQQPTVLNPGDPGCPNSQGSFTGSTTLVAGVPVISYPGVHKDAKGDVAMSQCLARPTNRSDPFLRGWQSSTVINATPPFLLNRFHDDSEAYVGLDGRWWMFVSGTYTTVKSTGVSWLYSSTDFQHWTSEHALWNISTGQCDFVSCPEMYDLPEMQAGARVYEAFCGPGDQYWMGTFNAVANKFLPDKAYTKQTGRYDWGCGKASKSFWDPSSKRRVMWSWVTEKRMGAYPGWDGAQSVPRRITYDAGSNALRINPVAEVAKLRGSRVVSADGIELNGSAPVWLNRTAGDALDIVATFEIDTAAATPGRIGLRLRLDPEQYSYTFAGFELSNDSYPFMNNTDLPGGDIGPDDFPLPMNTTDGPGTAACEAYCQKHADCTGWVFVRKLDNAPGAPRCAIKGANQTKPPSPSAKCISSYRDPSKNIKPPPFQAILDTSAVGGDTAGQTYAFPLSTATSGAASATVTLRILVDRSIVELYDGANVATGRAYPPAPDAAVGLQAVASTGGVTLSAQAWTMGSAVQA